MERACLILVLLAVVLATFAKPATEPPACSSDKLTVYKVVVSTFWSRNIFPKHYPDWRPPAQWSKTIGRTHDRSYTLFRLGERATSGVKLFAETGRSETLDAQSQGVAGVFDEFAAPAIQQGAGQVEARFFVDGNHSKVSLMSRIVPSPDWFIGVDSFDLCVNGNWLDSVTIELDPVDAGTDNGFTFTAPNWPTEPQGVVYRVTHTYPAHPAGSFYYPSKKRLPAIGTFQFTKLREYELAEEFHLSENAAHDVRRMEHLPRNTNDVINNDIDDEQETMRPPPSMRTTTTTLAPVTVAMNVSMVPAMSLPLPRGDRTAIRNDIIGRYQEASRGQRRPNRRGTKHIRKNRPPRDCRVTDWGSWGACSKSCGIGEMQRHRQVLKHARGGGSPCPILVETKWCGSARACSKGYFNW